MDEKETAEDTSEGVSKSALKIDGVGSNSDHKDANPNSQVQSIINMKTNQGLGFQISFPSISYDPSLLEAKPLHSMSNSSQNIQPSKLRKLNNGTKEKANLTILLACEWEQCSASFGKIEDFLRHVFNHSQNIMASFSQYNEDDNVPQYLCLWTDCGFECPDKREMVRHINFHAFHSRIKEEGKKALQNSNSPPCGLEAGNRNMLPDILEPFRCYWVDCDRNGEEFLEVQRFYWHVKGHGNELQGKKKHRCMWSGCSGKNFTSNSRLRDHLRTHTQEKLVACHVCGGFFASLAKLYDHCMRQVKEKLFKCDYCKKSYPSEKLLREHMRFHINQYKCSMCDMTCPTPSALDNHMWFKHNDSKPYQCEECGFKTKRPQDLIRHQDHKHSMEVHPCPVKDCSVTCSTPSKLSRHIASCHKDNVHESPYRKEICHICMMIFKRGNYLTHHLRKAHNFTWPSGHSRFRFQKGDDGFLQVLTVRFESADIAETATEGN